MSGLLRAIGLDVWFDVTPTLIAVASMYGTYYLLNRYHEQNEWSAVSTANPKRISLYTQNACTDIAYNYGIQAADIAGDGAAQEALAKATGAQYISWGCPDPNGNLVTYTKNKCGTYPEGCPSQLLNDPGCAATMTFLSNIPAMYTAACFAMRDCLNDLDQTVVPTDDGQGNIVCATACQLKCGSTANNGCCGFISIAMGDVSGVDNPCASKGQLYTSKTCQGYPILNCTTAKTLPWSANPTCATDCETQSTGF